MLLGFAYLFNVVPPDAYAGLVYAIALPAGFRKSV